MSKEEFLDKLKYTAQERFEKRLEELEERMKTTYPDAERRLYTKMFQKRNIPFTCWGRINEFFDDDTTNFREFVCQWDPHTDTWKKWDTMNEGLIALGLAPEK